VLHIYVYTHRTKYEQAVSFSDGSILSVLVKLLPDLDTTVVPSAVGLEGEDLDKLLPDFADKPSTVGLEVEDLDKLLPDFPDTNRLPLDLRSRPFVMQ
jgi:hypothetical protein